MAKEYTKTQNGKLRITETIEIVVEKEQSELEGEKLSLQSRKAGMLEEIAKIDARISAITEALSEAVKLDSKR